MIHLIQSIASAALAQDGTETVQDSATETANDAVAATDAATAGGAEPVAAEPKFDFSDPDAWIGFATDYGPKVLLALVLLIAGFILAGWVGAIVRKAMNKAKVDVTLGKFFGTMAKYVVLALVILTVLSTVGVETTSFAAVIAAMGFAVGLSLQGTLSNFSAGVMLLFFRPFSVGQFIKAAGEAGTVDAIGLFTTTLDTPDNRRIIMPNGSVFGGTIENVSHHEVRRVEVAVGADYGADLDKTREVLMGAVNSISDQLDNSNPDRQPAVVLAGLGDSSVDWKVRVWVKSGDFWPVSDSLTRAVKQHLDNAGIGIPFPQRDVHMIPQNG